MKYFILDIETKPDKNLVDTFNEGIKPAGNLKDPVKIEADIQKKKDAARKSMTVDQDYSDIICIGIKEVKGDADLYTIEEMQGWFNSFFNDIEDNTLVTFNGKDFDIPIIIKTGIKKGLNFDYRKLYQMTEKYKDNHHIDLMRLLSFNSNRGGNNYKSLDSYLRIYLGTQKATLGDEFFQTATEDEIKQHCLEDLQFTEDLLKKFRFLL